MSLALFGIWPYAALVASLVGLVWRWRTDQFGWTSRTSQLLERRWLGWGSPLFHAGALIAIMGHAAGLLVPASVTSALGVPEHAYHLMAVMGGALAGTLLTAGLVVLVIRRIRSRARLRFVTTGWDRVMYGLLSVIVAFGMYPTFALNVFGPGYDYRETIAVWFRSVFYLDPQVGLMAEAPWPYQVHVVAAFALFAIWPFTRLVHVFSIPLGYLARPYVVYRQKVRR
ncbi:MAG: respiratory nitrate reductase subunit gamma [Bifidobacteriaceae bacterium]|jgi:nitrate reductase gamma subunit|nr:respiratory nitrate reductase subunit gamma [Bifidobacteriaceae bacterium]